MSEVSRKKVSATLLPIGGLVPSFDTVNRRIVLTFAQTGVLTTGITVEMKTLTDETETDANHPYLWQLLTKRPISPASVNYFVRDVHELETYTFRLSTLDPLGNRSAYTTVTLTTPQFAPQNHLSLWSEDFSQTSQGIWALDSGVTIAAASGGGQLITLGAANKAVTQAVPSDPLGSKTYTLRTMVRAAVAGDVGKTINVFLNSPNDGGGTNNKLIALTASDQVVDHEVTFGSGFSGRYVNIGISSGNSASATQVIATRQQLHAGAAASAPAYEKTSGIGSTWQQACYMDNGRWWYALASTGYGGWHRSMVNGVHVIHMAGNAPGTLNLQAARTVSRSGDHIKFEYAGSYRLICNNHRARGLHPLANNLTRGRFVNGDFLYRFEVTNSWIDHTSGNSTQYFLGTGGTDTVKLLSNRIMDTDGRRTTAAGGYVLSPYSDLQNLPGGQVVGYTAVSNLRCGGLSNANKYLDGMEIAYNELFQRPGFGRVEDAWNLSGFSGTAASPIRVHHNLVQRLAWDFRWFADANRLSRTYSTGRIGDPGDSWYNDSSLYDSGTGGIPVDSSLHEWDFNRNGKNILVYSNVLLGVGSIISLLDGRNVLVRNNRHIASGNLPGLSVPVVGGGRVGGVQTTRYRQGQVTLTANAAANATSLALTSDLTDAFWSATAYKQFQFSNGVQFNFGYNGTKPSATSASIYNVQGNVPVGSTAVIATGMCYATITVTGTALTSSSSTMTYSSVITSGYRSGGFIVFTNGVTATLTADTVFADSNTLTVSALSGAVPSGAKGDYFDGYFSGNAVAEGEFRVPMPLAYLTGPISSGALDATTSRDNLTPGASTYADELNAYADWQALMMAFGKVAGPLVA